MPEDFIRKIYFRVGWYFTGKKLTNRFWIIAILIFMSINWFSYVYKLVVIPETLYWVFSSLVQGLLTLVALLVATSMFKIGQRKNNEGSGDANIFVPNQLHEFVVFTFTIVLISLVFLMFTPYISSYYLGWPFLYLIFILTSRSLFIVIKNVWENTFI